MKILHFADIHLGMENYGKLDAETGLSSRLGDFLKSFDFLVDYAINHKIDLAVFAGDAYKTRDPSPTYQREFAKRILKLSQQMPVVMTVGNHDFPNALGKADTLEIFPTLGVPNITVFKDAEIKIIDTKSGPIQVADLPWLTRSQLLSKNEFACGNAKDLVKTATHHLTEKLDYLSSRIDPKLPSLLVAHASIEGALYGSEQSISIGSEIALPLTTLRHAKFDYIALGHLHKFQQVLAKPLTIYPGSIERVDFGEEKEAKGFIIAEITDHKTVSSFIKTPARPFVSVRILIKEADVDPTEKVLQEIAKHKIKDAIVKVIIKVSEEKSAEIRETPIREALQDAHFIAGINKEIEKGDRVQTKNGFSDELASLDKIGLLEKYFKSKNISVKLMATLKKETEKLLEQE